MTMYTTLTTRRLIGFLCNLELQGFDGCLAVYADKAWAELPNGAIRSLPLAYRQEYGNRHEPPRCESCDLEKVTYLIRHAARIVLQWENCQDGGSVDSYTCYTRRTDNSHQWEESVEFPDDTLPF